MISAWATKAPGAPLEPFAYQEAALGPDDIEVAITHCGLCHSDVHMIDNDWGNTVYPLVPGHEIIGTVTQAGERVTPLEVGQRVGVGWQRSACLRCSFCIAGEQTFCEKAESTIVGHHGGFADRIRTSGSFAFPIPDALDSVNAAPLLCAGGTVFTPLVTNEVRATMRVAIVGIGGLGHLAVQFAAAWGCEVTAISTSPAKAKEAARLGAAHFLVAKEEELTKATGRFDFILVAVPASLPWLLYVDLLAPKGKLCLVGVPDKPLELAAFPLIVGHKAVCGSAITNRTRMEQMLEFAARHKIVAQTEVMPMSECNKAIDRLRHNQVRYRVVLEN